MNEPTQRDRARFISAGADERTIGLQWAAIRARRPQRPRNYRFAGAMLAAAAGLAVATFVLVRAPGRTSPIAGTVLESGAQQAFILPDGARIALEGDGRVRVITVDKGSVELALERGAATFDVPYRADRRLIVHVGEYDVIDLGTRFHIEHTRGEVIVQVDEGSVQIRSNVRQEPARFLAAGERWSSEPPPGPASLAPTPAPIPSGGVPSDLSPPPPVTGPSARPDAHGVLASAGPKELLDYADSAVMGGHHRDAALALDRLRRRFPRDPRAGLAAFQLGRLRFDTFGDAPGAAEAFVSAVALAPDAPFREDAQARLVEALDATGDAAKCARAQNAYVSRYPHGVYLVSVRSRCGSP